MCRCVACNNILTDKEAKRKHEKTGEELGLCDQCFGVVLDIQFIPVADPEDYDQLILDEDTEKLLSIEELFDSGRI